MAEITRRRFGEFVHGVLRIIQDRHDGMRARDVVAELEQTVAPTAFELTSYPSRPDVRRYDQMVRFASITPVKAGDEQYRRLLPLRPIYFLAPQNE